MNSFVIFIFRYGPAGVRRGGDAHPSSSSGITTELGFEKALG